MVARSAAIVGAVLGLVAPLAHHAVAAQAGIPVLKANSKTVDVRDGDRFLKGAWAIDPTTECDVFVARRSVREKRVTFITDVDSMSFDVAPGNTYDFVILLNHADSCRTRISTMQQSYRKDRARAAPDTIPFFILNDKIHIKASVNGSEPLDLMFDTGADILCLGPSALKKGAKITLDGSRLNYGFGGVTTRQTSSDNRLEVAGLIWDHESILYFGKKGGDSSDGILGYNVFEGTVVEINYGASVIVIRDSVPSEMDGYARLPMRFDGGVPTVKTTFNSGAMADHGWFVIDTGATAALQLKQDFVAVHNLYGTMKKIGSSTSRGVGAGKVRNDVVLLPELAFGDFVLYGVPTHLERPTEKESVSSGCLLGMDVLKRFNTILDYQSDVAYLRANSSFDSPFKTKFSGPPIAVFVAAALVAMFAMFAAKKRRDAHSSAAARS